MGFVFLAVLMTPICGYTVLKSLASSQADEPDFLGPSFLAVGDGDRRIVLKPIDKDCLFKNTLHPNVRERLARIRELPLGTVANLYGVERDPAGVWLVWAYVGGATLDAFCANAVMTPRDVARVARDTVLAVGAMHRRGIVHGALRASNVIVDVRGAVHLTHVSPLLYSDPGDDLWGLLTALGAAAEPTDAVPKSVELRDLVVDVQAQLEAAGEDAAERLKLLEDLAPRIGALIDVRGQAAPLPPEPPELAAAPAKHAVLGAAAVILFGVATALGAWWLLR